eukprot:TRINITY_DN68233_c0_g1_i1.p1 TRINITY_DN68233_c0_g1~~TRINITY_DN68233_c0_g1_i1.p1  ORF type:complete len:398 (-),score=88.35 TRINITY_DN68233_c0_g1_i1:41-1234(-)
MAVAQTMKKPSTLTSQQSTVSFTQRMTADKQFVNELDNLLRCPRGAVVRERIRGDYYEIASMKQELAVTARRIEAAEEAGRRSGMRDNLRALTEGREAREALDRLETREAELQKMTHELESVCVPFAGAAELRLQQDERIRELEECIENSKAQAEDRADIMLLYQKQIHQSQELVVKQANEIQELKACLSTEEQRVVELQNQDGFGDAHRIRAECEGRVYATVAMDLKTEISIMQRQQANSDVTIVELREELLAMQENIGAERERLEVSKQNTLECELDLEKRRKCCENLEEQVADLEHCKNDKDSELMVLLTLLEERNRQLEGVQPAFERSVDVERKFDRHTRHRQEEEVAFRQLKKDVEELQKLVKPKTAKSKAKSVPPRWNVRHLQKSGYFGPP